MGRKGKNASLEQRNLVLKLHLEGKTYKETAEMLDMKPNTVGDIVRRFKNEGRVALIKQKGQPKKLTDREEAEIVRKIKKILDLVLLNCRLNSLPIMERKFRRKLFGVP